MLTEVCTWQQSIYRVVLSTKGQRWFGREDHPASCSAAHAHTEEQRPVKVATTDLVDRLTQLICISDIYLLCQQTNTKDIAGQSAKLYGGQNEPFWGPRSAVEVS